MDPLLDELQAGLAHADARVLGPLIGALKRARHQLEATPAMGWLPVEGGHLAVGHRPGRKAFRQLRRQGTTHVVTLLSESEGAKPLGEAARAAGLDWFWLPMPSADVPDPSEEPLYLDGLSKLAEILRDGGKLYLHCSAGIHRTGMVAFALLRKLGYPRHEARQLLRELREETSTGVGEERLAWGDRVASLDRGEGAGNVNDGADLKKHHQAAQALAALPVAFTLVHGCVLLDDKRRPGEDMISKHLERCGGDAANVEYLVNRRFIVAHLLDDIMERPLRISEMNPAVCELIARIARIRAEQLRETLDETFPARSFDVEAVGADHVEEEPLEVCVTFFTRSE